MTDTNATPPAGDQPLQFDKVEGVGSGAGMACASCGKPIRHAYYDVDGSHVCLVCKHKFESSGGAAGWAPFLKAGVFGGAACVAGAAVYYGVIAITNFEIGIVAILIGWMVGKAIRMATGGRGGRKYQILAVGLTYFSVGLAYAPLAVQGAREAAKEARADSTKAAKDDEDAADSTAADSTEKPAEAPAAATKGKEADAGGGLMAIVMYLIGGGILLVFALPVIYVIGSLPSGIISAVIIGYAMRQAWRMTVGVDYTITGPFRLAGASAAPPPAEP